MLGDKKNLIWFWERFKQNENAKKFCIFVIVPTWSFIITIIIIIWESTQGMRTEVKGQASAVCSLSASV